MLFIHFSAAESIKQKCALVNATSAEEGSKCIA